MKSGLLPFIVLLLLQSCELPKDLKTSNNTLSSTLWIQTAAEYDALTIQAYNIAERMLPAAIDDHNWTASLEQGTDYQDMPPAIILDLDETALDNSYYEARTIIDETSFNPVTWNNWVRERQATAIEGAVNLTQKAEELGVAVFYITNRDAETQNATVENLIELGFPVTEGSVMSNGGEPDWTSAKTVRRELVAENHRIIMIFGDDLNDFLPARGFSIDTRRDMVHEHADKWSVKWFVLPNPNYGSWERALYTGDETNEEQRQQSRMDRLKTKR